LLEQFHHSALMYAGRDEFVAKCSAFLRAGIRAGEPGLVMVGPEKITALRDALGEDAGGVCFADMTQAGRNPAWIIPKWRAFAEANQGRRMRGIGEPIWAERTADELVECQRHESLINHAFADAVGFKLVCPYDTDALDADVIHEAECSHPVLAAEGSEKASDAYRGTEACAAPHVAPLPEPGGTVNGMPFGVTMIDAVRRAVERHAARAGLQEMRRQDLVLAVNELATNSVRHGGGYGRLRLWTDDDHVVCEVRDRGAIADPMAGRQLPFAPQPHGYGLWLAHQVCDLVQVRALPGGGVVRVHMSRA